MKAMPIANSLKSSQTRRTYSVCLKLYLKYCHIEEPDKLLKNDIKLMQADIIEYITSSQVSSLAYSTKYLYLSVLKHFYEMNDVVLNWKKISRYLGEYESGDCDDQSSVAIKVRHFNLKLLWYPTL